MDATKAHDIPLLLQLVEQHLAETLKSGQRFQGDDDIGHGYTLAEAVTAIVEEEYDNQ